MNEALTLTKNELASKRVMLIDSNPVVRKLLECFLKYSHQVAAYENYEVALNALKSPFMECIPPHVVIISVHLKQRSCIHVLAHLVHDTAYRETNVIMMVDGEEYKHRDMQRLLQLIKAHVVIKPIEVQNVLALVNGAASVPVDVFTPAQ